MSIRSEFVRLWNEFMASAKKITQLTALPSPVTTGDLLEVVRGGQNYKADGSQLPSGGGGGTWGSITGTLSAQADLQAALDLKESLYRPFDRKTSNYPLVLTDASRGIEMNMAGANTVTVPLNATQAFPIDTIIPIVQYGAGLTSVVATGGVTIRQQAGNLDSPGQYSPMFLKKIATDEWYLWNGTAGGGAVDAVVAGNLIDVDVTDPANPIVAFSASGTPGVSNYLRGDGAWVIPSAIEIAATPFGGVTGVHVAQQIGDVYQMVVNSSWKRAVRVATTVAGTLATSFNTGDTIDGVVLASGDRILIKNQSTQTENGIYTVSGGSPARTFDADATIELENATVQVNEGTVNANTTWIQTTNAPTIGSSNIVFASFGGSAPAASETVPGIAELATQAEVTTGTDDATIVTPLKLAVATRGVQDLFISASAMWPRTTGPCADLAKTEIATSLFNIQSLDFDQTTQEFCQFQIVLPRKWNNGTVTAVFYWTAAAGTGDVQWGISGGAYSNDDALTVALGSAITVDDTLIATNDLHITAATAAITLAGTPADADFLAFQISRNPASDTLNADAKLLGVSIRITTDLAIDA